MRALVTGISGFVGGSLATWLNSTGWDVSGFDQRPSKITSQLFVGSIQDQIALSDALEVARPDVIFHFAGVIKSQTPQDYYTTNVLGTESLFNAIINTGQKPRVLIASSSAVYGAGLGRRPITENFSLRPITDYAASKAAQEFVGRRFFLAYKIPVIILRTFNLVGPGQSSELACSAFARQIAQDELDSNPRPLMTGNLHSLRDFVDVRDAVQAYELLAIHGKPGLSYNICSGQAVSLQTCLDLMLGLAYKRLKVETDITKIQNNDVPVQVGSNKLVYETIGWKAKIPFETSLLDLLNYWRRQLLSSAE
jgi:GDP-4-dehydro-6-deoxy-D-mannose reductase